jgi:hypothetical protein
MQPVSIDFVAGSHGHFLEYVCNRFIAGITVEFSPFNTLGASHIKDADYIKNAKFLASHYSELATPTQSQIVKIKFDHSDLLLLISGCFLRAGDSNIHVNDLEINTYNKLKDGWFKDLLNEINTAYRKQGININQDNPNCPRYILREYFKFGFTDTSTNGFMRKLEELTYSADKRVFEFKFDWFYDSDKFLQQLDNLSKWYDTTLLHTDMIVTLHKTFLSKQIFKDHKSQCDDIIDCVNKRQSKFLPELTVLQESYINAILEQMYQIEMPFMQEKYFNSTQEIVQYLNV